jgi:hypothetical protein
VKRQRRFLQKVLSHGRPKAAWKAFSGILADTLILCPRLDRVVTIGPAPKVPSSVAFGGAGRKMAQGVGLRDQTPERGMYLAFQLRNFFGTHRKNPAFLKKFLVKCEKS